MKNQQTAAVLIKLRNGDKIDDKELVVAIETLEPIVDFLSIAGDIFFLPKKYLFGRLEQLKDFREARRNK